MGGPHTAGACPPPHFLPETLGWTGPWRAGAGILTVPCRGQAGCPARQSPVVPAGKGQGGALPHPNSTAGLRGSRTGQALGLEKLGAPVWGSRGKATS